VERVAVTAARSVPGVTSLEPTLASMATELGRAVRDAATGRAGEPVHAVESRAVGAGVELEMYLSVGARSARDVCADVARVVRQQVREQLAVRVVSVHTTVVDIAARPVGADE
jgi:uncharacterized alkaline shock family protein YloU